MTKREELIEQYTIRVEEPEGLKVKLTEHPPLFTGAQYKANELIEYAQSIEELRDDSVYIIDHNDNIFNVDAIKLRLAADGYFKEDTMVRIVCTSSGLCVESARIKI